MANKGVKKNPDPEADRNHIADLEAQVQAAKRLRAVKRARESLLAFRKITMPDPDAPDDPDASRYQETAVAKLLCDALEKVERGEILRLCVSVGPQFGKSDIISRGFPAWYMGRNPFKHFMLGTYSQDFANDFGGEVRELITGPSYRQIFPEFGFRKGSKAKDTMVTTKGGRMNFLGRGGAGSGKPADMMVIDDPIKDDKEAQSPTIRKDLWNWFNKVMLARCHRFTPIVIVHCLTGDTPITMADGTRKRLDAIRAGDEVLAYEGGRQVARKVLNWASQGEDEILELRTGNHCIRGNSKHPLLVDRGGKRGWIKLADIKRGDKVVCSGVERHRRRATINEKEAWLLGFMFGDGWITKRNAKTYDNVRDKYYPRRAAVTCVAVGADEATNELLVNYFGSVFGVVPRLTKYGYRRTEVQRIGRWFLDKGLEGKAKTKRLPGWLYSEPVEIRRAFLAGFVEADGHKNPHGHNRIGISNEGLLRDIRNLARSAGLLPTNVSVEAFVAHPPNSPKPVKGETWRVGWQDKKYVEDEFHLATVRSVNVVGRADVYDIQVEGSENFIADGLVVHNTRWHEDDLIGRLVDPSHPEHDPKVAAEWTYLNIPAVVREERLAAALGLTLRKEEDPDVIEQFGAEPIATLWPERKSLKFLAAARRLDKKAFESLYMGAPAPDDGDYFKRQDLVTYKNMTEVPKDLVMYGASDHALTEEERNDANCAGAFGVDAVGDLWIMPDLFWKRAETDETLEAILDRMKRHKILLWFAEDEHINKALGPFRRRMQRERGIHTAVQGISPGRRDLQARARSAQGMTQLNKIHFPEFAPWWQEAMNELLKFPSATHDDFVSFLAIACLGMDSLVKATPVKKEGNVYKVGTFGWIKKRAREEERAKKIKAAPAGW